MVLPTQPQTVTHSSLIKPWPGAALPTTCIACLAEHRQCLQNYEYLTSSPVNMQYPMTK
jgi:hypothetical protein